MEEELCKKLFLINFKFYLNNNNMYLKLLKLKENLIQFLP